MTFKLNLDRNGIPMEFFLDRNYHLHIRAHSCIYTTF